MRGRRITDAKRKAFLADLAKHGIVQWACDTSGISRSAAYREKVMSDDFSQAWEDAVRAGVEGLEKVAHQLATGTLEAVSERWTLIDGKLVLAERKIERRLSATMLIFLLKQRKPEVYGYGGGATAPEVSGDESLPRTALEEDWARVEANLSDEDADLLMDIFDRARDRSRES